MECSVDRLPVTEVAAGTVWDALSCYLLRLVSAHYSETWNGYEGKLSCYLQRLVSAHYSETWTGYEGK